MAVKIDLCTKHIIIHGLERKALKKLDRATSYYVDGYFYAPSFKARRWDGKEHLLKVRVDGSAKLPPGVFKNACRILEENDVPYVVNDKRKKRPRTLDVPWVGHPLRPYQEQAVQAFVKNDGRAILKMAIRSGKTLVAANLVQKIGRNALFVVPSIMLLHQAAKVLSDSLGFEVGKLGDSLIEPHPLVNIATIQTLVNLRKEGSPIYKSLVENVDFVILDEVHHASSDTWRDVTQDLDAHWVLGLTATPPMPKSDKGASKGSIWLLAVASEIVFETNIKDLIDAGWLVKPLIELHVIRKPELQKRVWTDDVRKKGILKNPFRNSIIVAKAFEQRDKGNRVLIICAQTVHSKELEKVFKDSGANVPTVTGKTPTAERTRIIDHFTKKIDPIIISTVLGEGVDMPSVEVAIMAAGGKSKITTVQRMRNLTKSEGKSSALIVEFLDLTNEYLAEHSRERLQTYREQGAFDFVVVE